MFCVEMEHGLAGQSLRHVPQPCLYAISGDPQSAAFELKLFPLTINSVCHIQMIIRGVQVIFRGTTRNNVLAKVDVAKEELP
jgi:hypothetical protein